MSRARPDAVALLLAGLLSAAAFFASGEPVVGVGALAAGLGLWAVWRLPVRITLLGVMFFSLAVGNPHERPADGFWESPLQPLAQLFYVNLAHHLPIPFLRTSGLELLLGLLFVVVLVRRARGSREDPPPLDSPRPLHQALLLAAVTLVALEAWGLARGGDVKQSMFQMRVMMALPLTAYLFLYALRGADDVRALARVVLWAAAVKVATGAYVYYVVCKPKGIIPPYVTTHTDTVLYVVALLILVARWWERPRLVSLLEGAALGGLIMVGVFLNDRRIAYASLLAGLAALYLVSPWNRAKRFVTRALLVGFPVLIAYVAMGWNSQWGRFYKPVRDLRSMVVSDDATRADASTQFRDLENTNLVITWREHPLVGAGFGHEWKEVVPLPDITRIMPNYRYQPHNGVLWLWTIGGLLGFSLSWLFLGVGVFFAARAYHRATAPSQRAAMLVAIGTVIAFVNQVFGDMGTQSYTSVFTVAPALALAGQLACSTGAWRGPARRVARAEDVVGALGGASA